MRLIDKDKLIESIKQAFELNMEGAILSASDMVEAIDQAPTVDQWHYPSKGELPDKDWSKHPLNMSKECFVLTKRGIGTIARWDDDYKTWFENQPPLPVRGVVAWQYFVPPKEEA